MTSTEKITAYYNELAPAYEQDRFDNTYGQYIHEQEKQLLDHLLPQKPMKTVNIGCGTGRFMELANTGLDISIQMLQEARNRFPNKTFFTGDAADSPFKNAQFEKAFSLHMLMHLSKSKTQMVISEMHRILKPGGQFIFDIPSKKRRQLSGYSATDWHAANEFTIDEIKELTGNQWKVELYHGILFFPVHRIPLQLRRFFLKLDNILCRSFLKEYASYLLVVMTKK